MIFHGLTLLLWKNFTLLKRRKCLTIFSIILPCLPILLILTILKNVFPPSSHKSPSTKFESFNLSDGEIFFYEILYTPSDVATDAIVAMLQEEIKFNNTKITKYNSEKDIENYILKTPVNKTCAIIFLGDFTGQNKNLNYKLRFTQDLLSYSLTDGMKQMPFVPGAADIMSKYGETPGYVTNRFIHLQFVIDKAIIANIHGKSKISELPFFDDMKIEYNRMPYPSYSTDLNIVLLKILLGNFIILSFMMIVVQVARNIVLEKEKRLKEALKIMGITNVTHWMGWFITFYIMTSIIVILMVLLLCLPLSLNGSILTKSNPFLLFIFLEIYSITMITFAFAASVLFKNATTASTIVSFLFFATVFLKFAINSNSSQSLKLILCLFFPNVGLVLGIDIICYLEVHRNGLTFTSLTSSIQSIRLINLIAFFILISAIYMIFTLYYERVFPGEYGIPLPWYLPFHNSCLSHAAHSDENNEDISIEPSRKKYFEEEPKNVKVGIQIRKLNKIFYPAGKKRIAVDNFSMNLYEGNITVLLGHNGAGKTTIMSILTGFLPPSDGTAYILGLDIRKDMDKIRNKLGLCPQYDILFDDLTVEEHMKLFTKLKGYKGVQLRDEIESKLKSVNLLDKKKALSKTLSGGMKRRLSIAMALTGGSEIVIMDEPTSGLDPHARHEMWTLLQNERNNRTILLSTHFMDEAEILGDRIGIMANGSLLCCGSPMFLKNAYGAEYHLTLVKKETFNISLIKEYLKECVPLYRLERDVSDEITFCLPVSSSGTFPKLFEKLEKNLNKLGVSSFGASITNIEQVFLKAENYEDFEIETLYLNSPTISNDPKPSSVETCSECPIKNEYFEKTSAFDQNQGFKLFLQQTIHIFLKNIFYNWRRKIRTIIYTIIPIGVFLLAFIGDMKGNDTDSKDQPSQSEIKMDLNLYSGNILTYKNVNVTNPQHKIYLDEFLNFFTTQSSSKSIESVTTTSSMDSYLLEKGEQDLTYYIDKYLLGLQLATITDKKSSKYIVSLLAYFNHEDIHSPPIMQNFISNILLRVSGKKDYVISTISHIFPLSMVTVLNLEHGDQLKKALALSLCLVFGLAIFYASFSEPIIEERTLKVKQLQYLSGCKTVSYWCGTFMRDFLHLLVVAVFLMIILVIFKQYAYLSNGRFVLTFFFFMLFAFAALPQLYLLTNLFSAPSSGTKWLTTIIAIATIVVFSTELIVSTSGIGGNFFLLLNSIISNLLFPLNALAQGFYQIYTNYGNIETCEKLNLYTSCENGRVTRCCNCLKEYGCYYNNRNYIGWEEPGVGKILILLALQGLCYWSIIFFLETSLFESLKLSCSKFKNDFFNEDDSQRNEDDDVAKEKERVNSTEVKNLILDESLVVKDLKKSYGKFKAVDGITFGIKPGVCFGLLGVNGAGKTTTFKMMTGEIRPTKGEVYINSHDLAKQFNEARKCIGFCPQEHVLLNELTARQQLTLYFNLRGFDTKIIPKEVDKLIYLLNLTTYADEPCGKYSGGNKRKLSTAIALVGNPELVFLDEPTSGMDPGARRHVWNTLTQYKANKKTLVLTSHSMEECEVLCNQVVIMVNGRFKCFGSIQHLKSKFAEGYTVLVQLNYPDEIKGQENIAKLIQYLDTNVKNYFVLDQRQSYLNLHFNKTTELSWSKLFGLFENIRESMNINHYSVSQASLESVFMRFAKEQIPPVYKEKSSGFCFCKCGKGSKVIEEPVATQNNTTTTTTTTTAAPQTGIQV